MGRRSALAGVALIVAAAVAHAATADTTHTYPVSLSISVERPQHRLSGEVFTEAPSEFCDSAPVRIMRSLPGKDKKAATVDPEESRYRFTVPPSLRGQRVYAEVLEYHLPDRPVVCLAGRSRTVTAP